MKHLFKRALALILTVLMVFGTLPMEALAARIVDDDAVSQTPVLDKDGPVADTLAKPDDDDDERPENPDPDPNPVDPSLADLSVTNFEVKSDGTWTITVHYGGSPNSNVDLGTVAFAIVPDVKIPGNAAAKDPTELWANDGEENAFTSATASSPANLQTALRPTQIPASILFTTGSAPGAKNLTDASGDISFSSTDWGKVAKWEELVEQIPTYLVNGGGTVNDKNTAPAAEKDIPYRVIFYSAAGNVGIISATTKMHKDNTDFELVSDTYHINSNGQEKLTFTLTNAVQADVDAGYATVVAGVPSTVDKITFVGTAADGGDLNFTFPATWNRTITIGGNLPVDQNHTSIGKTFNGATGYILVEYHKSTDDTQKKSLKITVAPTLTGQVTATPIIITMKAGETQTGSSTITNLKSSDKFILSETGYNDVTWADPTPEFPDPLPGDGHLTFVRNEAINANYEFDESGKVVTYSGTSLPTGKGTTLDVLTVTADATAVSGTYGPFTLTLNASDEEFSQESIPISVTVIVEGEAPSHKVIFKHNWPAGAAGSDPGDTDKTVQEGAAIGAYNMPSATPDGYAFVGWFDTAAATGGNGYNPTTRMSTSDLIYFARWEKNVEYSYSLTYDGNGSDGGTVPTAQNHGPVSDTTHSFTISSDEPTLTGHDFKGWLSNETTPKTYQPGDPITITGVANGTASVTLTAQWEKLDRTITYDWNGKTPTNSGVSKPDDATVKYGEDYTVDASLSESVVYTTSDGRGWTFGGWSTTGTAPKQDTLTNVTAETTTLKAIWTEKTVKVTYDKGVITTNDSDAAAKVTLPSDETPQYGTDYTVGSISGDLADTDGWRFDSWLDSVTNAVAGATIDNIVVDHTLTAQWKVKVDFDINLPSGESGPTAPDAQWLSVGGKLSGNPQPSSTLTNYAFKGWSTDTSADNIITVGTKTFSAPDTLYAIWGANEFTITWNPKSGKFSDDTTANKTNTDEYGKTVTIPTGLTREGYTFAGWYGAEDYSGSALTGTDVTITGNKTYYAKWDINKHKVTWNGNGGGWTGGDTTKETTNVSYGAVISEYETEPTRDNYTFAGWYTAEEGGSKVDFTKTAPTMPDEDVIYYAHWTRIQIKVTYQDSTPAHAASGIPTSITNHPSGNDYTVDATEPTPNAGYTFKHWSGSDGGTYAAGDTIMGLAADITLTAVWEQKNHTLTWNANGGKWAADNATKKTVTNMHYDDPIKPKVPDPDPERDNYRFLGWSATNGGAVVTFTDDSPKMPDSNDEYFAKWQGLSWVKFDPDGGAWSAAAGDNAVKTYQGDTNTALDTNHPGQPTKSGYTFGGWKRSTDDATVAHANIGSEKFPATPGAVDADTTVTYTAIWTADPATVTVNIYLDGNAAANLSDAPVGSGKVQLSTAPGTLTGAKDLGKNAQGVYKATDVTTSKDGAITYYVFVAGKDTGETVSVSPGGSATANVQYWTVEYKDPDNHKASSATLPADEYILDGEKHTVKDGIAGDTGWSFKAWNDGTDDQAKDTELTITAKTTLNATWNEVKFTVVFNKNGHGPNTDPMTARLGTDTANFPTATTMTEAGWHFQGWYEATNFSGTAVTKLNKDTAGTYNVYAKWTYSVTYYNNNAAIAVGTVPNAPGATMVTIADGGVDNGTTAATMTDAQYYTFTGWNTKADGTGTPYAAGATVKGGDKELYAQWERKTAEVTVTVNLDGNPGGVGKDVDVTVNGVTKTVADTASADDAKLTFTVPQGPNGYDVTVGGSPTGWTSPKVYAPSGTGKPAHADVHFYTLTLTVADSADGAKHGKVAQSDAAIAAGDWGTNGETKAKVYMDRTEVNIDAASTDSLYIFGGWTGDSAPADKTTTVTIDGTYTWAATFNKDKFDAKLDLKANTSPVSNTDVTAGTKVTAVSLTYNGTTVAIQYNSTDKVWESTNPIKDVAGATGTWTVTTVDGGSYTVSMGKDANIATMSLFGVTVVDGDYGNNTNHPKVKTVDNGKAYMPIGTSYTVAIDANPDNGYTWASWVESDDAAVRDKVSYPSGKTGNVSFQEGYSNNADLELKPTYTYEVPVELRYDKADGDLVPDQTVTVTPAGPDVDNKGTNNTGEFVISDMTPGSKYKVVVNGYESELELDSTMASTTTAQVIILHKITAVVSPTAAGGTPKVNGTAGATGIYVPNKAALTNEDGKPKVTVSVDASPAAGYRWRNQGTTEKLWEGTNSPTIVSDTTVSTVITKASVEGDIVMTAYAIQQWDATVVVSGANNASTDAKFTAVTGVGSRIDTGTTNKSHKATVDDGGYLTTVFSAGTGDTLDGWTFENGELYKTKNADGTLADKLDDTAAAAYKGETVYFKPTEAGAKVTAKVTARKYPITINVNLDNAGYADKDGNTVQVMINDAAKNQTYNFSDFTKTADGVYTVNALPGNYDIYVNGLDISKTVAATTAFDTGKNLNFSADDAESEDTSNLTKTVNYYTLVLKSAPSAGGNVDFAASTTATANKNTAEKIFLAYEGAAGSAINIASEPTDATSAHYRFVGWTKKIDETNEFPGTIANATTAKNTTYTPPQEEDLTGITTENKLTLTANFKKQFKVNIEKGKNANNDVVPLGRDHALSSGSWTTEIFVDEGGAVDLHTAGANGNYYFKDWTIKVVDGTPVGKGKFNITETDTTGQDTGTIKVDPASGDADKIGNTNTFHPEADTTVLLNLWLEPTLTKGAWTWDRGTGSLTDPKPPYGANDKVPKKLTWTANDSQYEPTSIVVAVDATKSPGVTWEGTTGNQKTLVKDTDYTVAETAAGSGIYVYTFTDALINSMPQADYDVTFTYTLGETVNEVPNQEKAGTFGILISAYTLTKVDIGVATAKVSDDYTGKPDKTLTMNIDATDEKANQVLYLEKTTGGDLSHVDHNIEKKDLTFTWYWSASKPDQKVLSPDEISALNAATPSYPGGATWTKLTDDVANNFTRNETGYTAVPSFTSNGTDYAALKGNYVFAVVTADVTGKGSVITNAILVDYDATISVYEDGTDETDLVDGTEKGGYAVYLWPTDGGDFPTDPTATGSGAIPATWSNTDSKFHTTGSQLNAAKKYNVYVREVEGSTTYVQLKTDAGAAKEISRTAPTATAEYYTVTLTDLGKKGWTSGAADTNDNHKYLVHATDGTTPTAQEVGETWTYAAMPKVEAETAVNKVTVDSGKAVLKNTTLKATAADLGGGNAGKGWTQDYNLEWHSDVAAQGNVVKVSNDDQTNITAVSDGYTSAGITHATEITGKLKQNVYTITGNILNADKKNQGQIASATLTVKNGDKTYVFNNLTTGGFTGYYNTNVQFKVPKSGVTGAINTTYTIAAVEKDQNTTIRGYSAPAATVDAWKAAGVDSTDVEVAADKITGRFTIFVSATDRTLEVKDNDDPLPTGHSASAAVKLPNVPTAKHEETDWVFYNYLTAGSTWTKKVILTNKGNVDLDVTLTLQKDTYTFASDTWSGYQNITLGGDDNDTDTANNIVFTGLPTTAFTLEPGEEKAVEFTVTVPSDLDNDDDVKYRFVFSSVETRNNAVEGPSLNFDLELTIDPVKVVKVKTNKTVAADGTTTFAVDKTWIDKDRTNLTDFIDADANKTSGTFGQLHRPQVAGDLNGDGTPKDTNDLVYTWYTADWWEPVTLNTTKGVPELNGTALTPLTTGVSKDTLSYVLQPSEEGKALYLVVSGKNNASFAAMTPEETETKVLAPFSAKIKVFENGDSVTDAKDDQYKVYLWDPANGNFPEDPETNDKVIKTQFVVGSGTEKYDTNYYEPTVGLEHKIKYHVYTNVVGNNMTAYKDTGKIIGMYEEAGAHKEALTADVVYHEVKIANTTVHQNDYQNADGTNRLGVTMGNTDLFYAAAPGNPSAVVKDTTLDAANKWVQTGTEVTFTYTKWDKDYDLTWKGAVGSTAGVTDKAGAGMDATHDATYSSQLAEVTTELKLNLYNVRAQVEGSSGSVDYVTMTLTDHVGETEKTYVFTSKENTPSADAIRGVATSWDSGIAVTQTAIFRLPKTKTGTTYLTEATKTDTAIKFTGYTYDGTRYPYTEGVDPSPTNHKTINVAVNGDTGYLMHLQGKGLALQISDNAGTTVTPPPTGVKAKATNNPQNAMGAASIADGKAGTPAPATQEIYLNYNYNEDLVITITGLNNSMQGTTKQVLKNLQFVQTTNNKTTHLVLSDNEMETAENLDCSGTGTDEDPYVGLSKTAKLTIKKGLPVGEYTFVGTFSFEDSSTPAVSTSVTYTLKVVVEPLPFTAVKIIEEETGGVKTGNLTLENYTVTRKAEGAETADVDIVDEPNATNTAADPETALIQNNDYKYQWISVKSGATPAVTWTNGTLSYGTDTKACTEANNNTKTYKPGTSDQGRDLYLVIYANAQGDGINADEYAISNKIVNTYPGIVALKVDTQNARNENAATDKSNNKGKAYTVEFVNLDATAENPIANTPATWKQVGTEWAYVADLVPNTNGYSIKISRAKNDGQLVPLVLSSGAAKVDHSDLTTTIDPTKSNVVEAPFFTVNAQEFTAAEFKTGTGESFTKPNGSDPQTAKTHITPGLTIGDDKAALDNNTPVLSGQKVTAKAPAMSEAAPDNNKAWKQDYKLTWQEKESTDAGTTTTFAPADDKTAAANRISGTDAVRDENAYTKTITAKTFIGGRLDQTTYTVTGSVKNLTGHTGGHVDSVELAFKKSADTDTRAFKFISYTATQPADDTTQKVYATGAMTDTGTTANNNIYGEPGDTITFTVVKGQYDITAHDGTSTTIQRVTIGGVGDSAHTDEVNDDKTRNKETMTPAVADNTRLFTVYVAGTAMKLGVTDDEGTAATDHNKAESAKSQATDPKDNKRAKNEEIHYFNLTEGEFNLTLNNNGNTDLKVSAQIYKTTKAELAAITDWSNTAQLGTLQTIDASRSWTDTDVAKFTNMLVDETAVNVGDGIETGKPAVPAGKITLDVKADKADSKVYIIRYSSKYTDSKDTEYDGPTVYYVLDLTVKPLPIKKVTTSTDNDGTIRLENYAPTDPAVSGLNSVRVAKNDNDTTDPWTGAEASKLTDAGGTGDIKYAWAKAPVSVTVDHGSFTLNNGTLALTPAATAAKVEIVAGESGKTYKPTDAEQGMNFYLIAYSAGDTKNATDFAVSKAVYAQVNISLEVYRTDKKAEGTLTDVEIIGVLPAATEGAADETHTSNTDWTTNPGFVVKGDETTLNFTADMTAATSASRKKGDDPVKDDPVTAKYYFHHWAVKPLDPTAEITTDLTTPVDGDRLALSYPVTEQATVIGYYDLLPTLKGKGNLSAMSYILDDDTTRADARTLDYGLNDGSGNIVIAVEPANSTFSFKDPNTKRIVLGVGDFDSINGKTSTSDKMNEFGKAGEYVLTHKWINDNLNKTSQYIITVYDKTKGAFSDVTKDAKTPNVGGYAGYDRSIPLTITAGNVNVTARAEDMDLNTAGPQTGGTVRLIAKSDDANTVGWATEMVKQTEDGSINAEAKPNPGYVFKEWKVLTNEDDPAVANGGLLTPDNNDPSKVTFVPEGVGSIIEAYFVPAEFTAEKGYAEVYYGNTTFETGTKADGTTEKLVQIAASSAATGVQFTYDLLTESEAKAHLNVADGADLPANVYYNSEGTNKIPAWLKHEVDANNQLVFSVNGEAKGVNVDKERNPDGSLKLDENDEPIDVPNELVVYVKITTQADKTGKVVPFTVDVITTPLKINTANTNAGENQPKLDGTAYADLFKVAVDDTTYPGEGRGIKDGDKVFFDYFNYHNVQSTKNGADYVDGAAGANGHAAYAAGAVRFNKLDDDTRADYGKVTNGYWTVKEETFDGTGNKEYVPPEDPNYPAKNAHDYKFTFHYTGDTDTDADNWNYSDTEITLSIEAEAPEMSLKFADEMKASNKPAATPFDVTPGTSYSDYTDTAANKTTSGAPLTLNYVPEAKRENEHITYLDNEPIYTVKLKKAGTMYNATLTEDTGTDGFKVVGNLPDINTTDTEFTFQVQLTAKNSDPTLWAGEHHISFTATGNSKENGTGSTTTATYELTLFIDPKVITSLDVETEKPSDTTPKKVEGTLEEDPAKVDLTKKDAKGNEPLEKITITPTPGPDESTTKVEVEVEIDPNYVYTKDDPNTGDVTEPEITDETTFNGKDKTDENIEINRKPLPDDENDTDHIVVITQKIPYLMHDDVKDGTTSTTGPKVEDTNGASITQGANPDTLGTYTINLGAYGSNVYDVEWTVDENDLAALGATLTPIETWDDDLTSGDAAKKNSYKLDLTAVDTSKTGTFVLKLIGKGAATKDGLKTIESTYTFTLKINNKPTPPTPGDPVEPCPCKVFYHIGIHGTTENATVEDVSEGNRPSKIPTVTPLENYVFRGWSLTNPATLKKGEKPVLVDPKTVDVKGETMTFYAVIMERPFHEHYVIGYPNGNFGPADNIDRASVATIIARAILPGFVEGAGYGNPGGYSDVSGHWAESAIAYCSKYGVFEGYTDGTFKPNQPITRQEFALVMARLDGVMTPGEMDFADIEEAGPWALGGIYTAYKKGWVNGYTDGTFKPLNNIRRDEAVKVFNAYLHRGVDADGLAKLHEYVHSGVASNLTGNGTDEYMTWPDVPKGHWAYYEIVEAANDHEYVVDFESELGYTLPEEWDKCWIDERWRYHDDINDGGPNAALVSAGFRVWLH